MKIKIPLQRVEYPVGCFIQTDKGYFYISSNSPNYKRLRILTKRLLNSWSPLAVIVTSEKAVSHYRVAAKLKYRNGSLIHNYADGKLYLISEGKRRQIVSPDVLQFLGLRLVDAVDVSQDEINLHEEGEPIS